MESDENERVSHFEYENYPLPENMDELRAQLLTPAGWPTNSPAISPQHGGVPANYRPATPIYSPTSPDYSPSMLALITLTT